MKQFSAVDFEKSLVIFTDGSSLGNPGPGGYGAVIVFPMLDEAIELGGNKILTTNNEMELTAVVSALSYSMANTAPLYVFTDSSYVINGITKWVHGWEKNNWKTLAKQDVSHRALWETLISLVRARETQAPIVWQYVPGHVGVAGNERCDVIATSHASGKPTALFRGKLSVYMSQVAPNILSLAIDTDLETKKKSKKTTSSGKAYAYLSMVDGVIVKHDTWVQCEARVKGVKGRVKFKKVTSESDMQDVMREWKK